jgi:hypothetical protein
MFKCDYMVQAEGGKWNIEMLGREMLPSTLMMHQSSEWTDSQGSHRLFLIDAKTLTNVVSSAFFSYLNYEE